MTQRYLMIKDLAEEYVKRGWKVGQGADAFEKCIVEHKDDVTMSALLRILTLLDEFSTTLGSFYVKRRWKELETEARKNFDLLISELEAKHGPCPDDLRHHLRTVGIPQIRSWDLASPEGGLYVWVAAPKKGTKFRSAWDRWKRTKAGKRKCESRPS